MEGNQETQKSGGGFGWGAMVGDIVTAIPGIVTAFDKEGQANQVAIAQANAETARANAQANSSSGFMGIDKKWLMIGGGLIVLIILVLIMKNK